MDILGFVPEVLRWAADNPAEAIIVFIVLYWIWGKVKENKRDLMVQGAVYFVAQAEDKWNSGDGKIKFAEVYSALQKKYPVLSFFFSKETMEGIIEEALTTFNTSMARKDQQEKMNKVVQQQQQLIESHRDLAQAHEILSENQFKQEKHINNVIEEQQALAVQVNAVLQERPGDSIEPPGD